ncbi:hypothetical protein RRG08_038549 [Elysia crispata]|uniref:Uncharacterized protein n=1 Tax=Elysia crispata TaxID=231223 RepID=A0AAE1ART6_9GAST|nr:hypothetical protein RRG08_038549 [Elysia crispata]
MSFSRKETLKKYSSIIGAHFVMAPFSFVWVYGNLSAYMDSYFRFSCAPGCMDGESQWILGIVNIMICPGILITKYLSDKMGLYWTGAASAVVLNASLFGCALVVRYSVAWTTVLLGAVMGLVQGITSVVVFQNVGAWAPDKATIFIASTTVAPTVLSMVQNQIITAVVNPDNLKPDAMQGPRTFFSQPSLLSRVPTAIIIYAATILASQIIGYILLTPPPKPSYLTETLNVKVSPDRREPCSDDARPSDTSPLKSLQNSKTQANEQSSENHGSYCTLNSSTSHGLIESNGFNSTVDINMEKMTNPPPTESKSLTPSQALKTPCFYAVFMFVTATVYALILQANCYKEFALLYIHNDKYLTLVGTLIPFVASSSRLCIGTVLNKRLITIKDAIVISLSINSAFCAIWYLVPQVSAVLYMFLILCLAMVQSQYYVVIPVACLEIFGPAHFSINYGLMLSGLILAGILGAVIISPLIHAFGWFWLFESASILCLVTLLLVVFTDFNVQQSAL